MIYFLPFSFSPSVSGWVSSIRNKHSHFFEYTRPCIEGGQITDSAGRWGENLFSLCVCVDGTNTYLLNLFWWSKWKARKLLIETWMALLSAVMNFAQLPCCICELWLLLLAGSVENWSALPFLQRTSLANALETPAGDAWTLQEFCPKCSWKHL